MNKIICWFRGHQFSRWSFNKMTCHRVRTCKRCGKQEMSGPHTPFSRKLAAQQREAA